jgi:hypothetical protein
MIDLVEIVEKLNGGFEGGSSMKNGFIEAIAMPLYWRRTHEKKRNAKID